MSRSSRGYNFFLNAQNYLVLKKKGTARVNERGLVLSIDGKWEKGKPGENKSVTIVLGNGTHRICTGPINYGTSV